MFQRFLREAAHTMVWVRRHRTGRLTAVEAAPLRSFVHPTDVLLDVGAHAGSWTVPMSKLVPGGWVYAFEALPYYARVLRKTLRLLGCRNVEVVNGAVLDRSRTVQLVWRDPTGNRLTGLTHVRGTEESGGDSIAVAGVTLDDFAAGIAGPIRFIKLDIEGAELAALKGAVRVLDEHRPLLFVEINEAFCARYGHSPTELFSFLSDREYRGFLHDGGWIDVNGADFSGKGDVWFVPVERVSDIRSS